MTLTDIVIQKIIRRLLNGEDYRVEIVELINAQFLQYAIGFFRRIVSAKFDNEIISGDWYKREFLDPNLPTSELIINSGLNKKTIENMYNSVRREIVLKVTEEYYDALHETINTLANQSNDVEIELTIKLGAVSVDLNLSESLIVVNTLAVKRSEIRGGAWSTAGKQVEIPLMRTLAKLYSVPEENYKLKGLTSEDREIDFHFIDKNSNEKNCEVKLMGKGNPESADAVIARDTDIFVADKLSKTNKSQLPKRGAEWVELRSPEGYRRMYEVLQKLGIPCQDFNGDLDDRLDVILPALFE
jgi:hypothetical protein